MLMSCALVVPGDQAEIGFTLQKPVGLDHLHAVGPTGQESRHMELPGDRAMIRGRATTAALHLVRRLLEKRHSHA